MQNSKRVMRASCLAVCLALLSIGGTSHADEDRAATTREMLEAAMQRQAQSARPPFIERDALLRESPINNVQLAPDGKHLSFFRRDAQQTDLYIRDLAGGKETRVQADVRGMDVAWSGDGRLLWLADADGLAVFDVDGRTGRRMFRWDADRHQRLFGIDPHATSHAIISERTQRDGARWYRYLLVDAKGSTRVLHEAARPLRGVLLTADAKLAYSATYDGTDYDTVIRRHDERGVHELLRCRGIEQCRLIEYLNSSGQSSGQSMAQLWVLSHHGENTLSLQRWQENTGQWKTLHRDPDGMADASRVLWQPGGQWLGIAYHPDRRRWYGSNPAMHAKLAELSRQLPGANLGLSASADGKRWLVHAEHATWQFDRYFLYEPADNTLHELFADETAAALSPEIFSAALPVSYRASDDFLLHGYVLLPAGVALADAPLIAMLHGGPFNRERDNFSAIAQLLVNRGYAVFLPNFRASTGYGKRYLLAANGEFGKGRVLQDVFDGLDFLLALGIGDRERQAVMGHSFGGYATLLALSHAPSRFRFGIASAAPPDFDWTMQWIADNGGSALPEDGPPAELFFAQHGMPFADAEWKARMRRESPLRQVARLRTPLYMWAGAEDDRVPLKSVVAYTAAARDARAPVSLLIDPESGHNPGAALNLEAIVFLIEAAAHRHFGGGLSPPSPVLGRFLKHNLRVDDANVMP